MEEERRVKAGLRRAACADCAASTMCASGFLDQRGPQINVQKMYIAGGREEIELSWLVNSVGLYASNKHGGVVSGKMRRCSVYIPRLCPRLRIQRFPPNEPHAYTADFNSINAVKLSDAKYQQEIRSRLAVLDDNERFHFE